MSATRRGGRASVDARTPDRASVGGACCDARGGTCLASCWMIVGADKTLGCGAAAGPPRRSVLLPPASLSELEAPSFAGTLSFSFSSFSFRLGVTACCRLSWRQHRCGPPRTASTRVQARARPSSRTVRVRRRKGRCRYGRNRGTRACGGTRR